MKPNTESPKCAVRLTSPSEWIVPAERAALAVSTRLYQAERDVPKVPLKPGELAAMIEAEYAPVISGLEAMNRHTVAETVRLHEAFAKLVSQVQSYTPCSRFFKEELDAAALALQLK